MHLPVIIVIDRFSEAQLKALGKQLQLWPEHPPITLVKRVPFSPAQLAHWLVVILHFLVVSQTEKHAKANTLLIYTQEALNLKGVDNFKNDEAGQKYITFLHAHNRVWRKLVSVWRLRRPGELRELTNNVASAVQNKISSATDCLGRGVMTAAD